MSDLEPEALFLSASPFSACENEPPFTLSDPYVIGSSISGTILGKLVGFSAQDHVPLVVFPQQAGGRAVAARSTCSLHGVHVGREVVLTFENNDSSRPIVIGC